MRALIALSLFFGTRITLICFWIFTDYMSQAFSGLLWPILGVIFMPCLTLGWVIIQLNGGLSGWWWAFLIFSVICDFIANGSGFAGKKSSSESD